MCTEVKALDLVEEVLLTVHPTDFCGPQLLQKEMG